MVLLMDEDGTSIVSDGDKVDGISMPEVPEGSIAFLLEDMTGDPDSVEAAFTLFIIVTGLDILSPVDLVSMTL